jgi:hypothetical protein
VLSLLLLVTIAPAAAGSSELHVRASVAIAPCVAPVVEAWNRKGGPRAALVVGLPTPVGNADIVIGDDPEMTRVLEGGTAATATAVELGAMPWVHVTPEGLGAAAAGAPVAVLGGDAGREARVLLGRSRSRVEVTTDAAELRRAATALVPVSLAGPGTRRLADVPPVQATAAEVVASRNGAAARRFLAFLRTAEARVALDRCFAATAATTPAVPAAMDAYGKAVVDWWLPECSRIRNAYNDPLQAIGPPDAANLGGPDRYRGLISLGQGGYVTLELGEPARDGPGADIRVFQTATGEPVTLYAASAAQGPFVLVGLRRPCGVRTPGVFPNHCDFDLRDAGLTSARFVKVEDGEIYPCLAGGTLTEGADLDAVQTLNK